MASSIIGATEVDAVVFGVALAAAVGLVVRYRAKLMLLTMDRAMAGAIGLNVRRWSFAIAAALGLAIGLSIRAAGMLYAFGCLVLPALAAKHLSRSLAPLFWIAPLLALIGSTAGFVLGNHYDFPPAQITVATLSLFLLFAWPVGVFLRSRE